MNNTTVIEAGKTTTLPDGDVFCSPVMSLCTRPIMHFVVGYFPPTPMGFASELILYFIFNLNF